MKTFRHFAWLGWLLLGAGTGWSVGLLNHGPVVMQQDAVVAEVSQGSHTTQLHPEAGGYIDIAPSTPASTLLVFYPGGLVRPQAYEWLGVALVPFGVRTVIPIFPLDLAVIDKNRIRKLLDHLQPRIPVLLGGHSLGGAMAASTLKANPQGISGLILMGAYPASSDDLSGLNLPVLTLAAEHDGLATLADIRDSLKRLPSSTEQVVVKGSVHAFFGRYGPQKGDGLPTVTHGAAEQQITRAIQKFLSHLL